MRIKKFNEMFDTEELKSQHEIAMIQGGLLKGVKFKKLSSDETIYDLIAKMIYKFPFLSKFNEWENEKYEDTIFFYTRNDYWYISLSLSIEDKDTYGVGILYKYIDSIPNAPVKHTLAFSGKDNQYFTEWNNNTFDDVVRLVDIVFIPLLNRLGFKEEISYYKSVSTRRSN